MTVTVERADGGKLRCTGATWSDAVVIYPGEALALANNERHLPKGWALVVLADQVLELRGQRQLVATAEAGDKLPVGCPAWHDRAVVVPVVPVAADT
jgi:hypothetical protein